MAYPDRSAVVRLEEDLRGTVELFAGQSASGRDACFGAFSLKKGWAASEKGETCGPKGGEERCFRIAICYGKQASGGKGCPACKAYYSDRCWSGRVMGVALG